MTDIQVVNDTMLQIREENISFIKRQYDLFRELQKQVLEEGVDYGYPSGKRSPEQKPSLYKSGAEKLTRLFNLVADFSLVKEIEKDDFIFYEFKCTLQTQSGRVVGVGYGACNSRERNAWNANPWQHQNTILKMAKKRAHVDAVLTGLGASNVFTQDLEDFENTADEKTPQKQTQSQAATENTTEAQTKEEQTQQAEPASDKQLKKLIVMMKQVAQLTDSTLEDVERDIKTQFGINHLNELTKTQASQVIDHLQVILNSLAEGGN